MPIQSDGTVTVDSIQELQNLGDYFHNDFDEVAHDLEDAAKKGDENDIMANLLNY